MFTRGVARFTYKLLDPGNNAFLFGARKTRELPDDFQVFIQVFQFVIAANQTGNGLRKHKPKCFLHGQVIWNDRVTASNLVPAEELAITE